MPLFTNDDLATLAGPNVARCWFGEFDLPSGYAYLHAGVGKVTVDGQEWTGVTSPVGQLVSVSAVDNVRFGQAAKVDIVISGVNLEFFQSVRENAADIEGRTAILRMGVFDPETEMLRLFKPMFPGKMSAPTMHRQGVGTRYIVLSIEGFWEAQNYPFGGKWSPADQRRRYPGDKGLDFVGVKVREQFK